jgi:hypothetical protein
METILAKAAAAQSVCCSVVRSKEKGVTRKYLHEALPRGVLGGGRGHGLARLEEVGECLARLGVAVLEREAGALLVLVAPAPRLRCRVVALHVQVPVAAQPPRLELEEKNG